MKSPRFRVVSGVVRAWLVVVTVMVAVVVQAQMERPQPVVPQVRSIAITATDRVVRQADVATVHIGYEYFGVDKDAAYAAASKASNAIIDALRAAGVKSDAIESQDQSVEPTQMYALTQWPEGERAAHAFTAQQSWTVRSTPGDAARVVDIAVKAGANKSGNIDWSLKDPNAASAEAAAKALQRARAQAEAMAAGLGVKLGELLYASNTVEAQPVRPMFAMDVVNGRVKAAPRPLAISPQQIETSATVRAVFAIE